MRWKDENSPTNWRSLRKLLVNNGLESRTSGVFHIEFAHILNGLEVKTVKTVFTSKTSRRRLYLINVVSVTDCRRHHACHAHVQVCLNFSLVFWNYNVCMFGLFFLMSTFHCWGNFILKTRFYSTLQFRETLCDVYRKPVKPVFWSTIILVLGVISTLLSEVE